MIHNHRSPAKVVITMANNGFIVKTDCHGLDIMNEPYFKPLLVFEKFEDLVKYLKKIDEGREK